MKTPVLALIISLFMVPLASAQEGPCSHSDDILQGRIDRSEFLISPLSDHDQGSPSIDTAPAASPPTTRRGALRSVAGGIARTIYHAGVISGSAAVVALEAMSGSYDTNSYQEGSFVPSSTYGIDSCVHGYTTARCPYSSYGNSYGSMYLSGRGTTRYRPDYAGGYRYYSSTGDYGTIRPAYTGGYSVTSVNAGPYHAVSLQSARYGCSSRGYRSW